MDTVRSWVDACEVRRLAEGLMAPLQEKVEAPGEAGYSKEFEGYAGNHQTGSVAAEQESEAVSAPLASVTSALAAARKVAEGSGMLQRPVSAEPVEVEQVEVEVRGLDLQKLTQSHQKWAAQYGMAGMVLIGRDDEVVSDTLGNAKLTEMILRMVKSAPKSGSLFVKVGAKACLQVVVLASNHGLEAIGMMIDSSLSKAQIEQLHVSVAQDLG